MRILSHQTHACPQTVTHSGNTHTCDLSTNKDFLLTAQAASNTIALSVESKDVGQAGNIIITNVGSGTVSFAALPSYMLTPDGATVNFVTSNNAVSIISYYVLQCTDAADSSTWKVLVNYVGNFA